MSWATVAASVGGSLLGGMMQSDATEEAANIQAKSAQQAADTQLAASREANQLQAAALQQQLLTSAPAYRSGNIALSALMGGMGLGPVQAPQRQTAMPGYNQPTYTNAAGQTVDAQGKPVVDATYGLGNIYHGPSQSELDAAAGQFANQLNQTYTGQDLYSDPSYQFRLNEGARAIAARQAAAGNRFSGQALKDITNYGQEAASQEFANAHARFMQNKEALYNRLSNLAGIGTQAGSSMGAATSAAAGQMGANTMQGARGVSDYLTSGASAQAGGIMGSTRALVGGLNTGINSGLNNYFTMQYLNGLNKKVPPPGD